MKYETYLEVMEALRFRHNELLFRATEFDNRASETERERRRQNLGAKCEKIKLAARELTHDPHWQRFIRDDIHTAKWVGIRSKSHD